MGHSVLVRLGKIRAEEPKDGQKVQYNEFDCLAKVPLKYNISLNPNHSLIIVGLPS